jgi:hypothetical protein
LQTPVFRFLYPAAPVVLIKQRSSFLTFPGKPLNLFIIKAFRFSRFFLSTQNSPIVPNLWLSFYFNNTYMFFYYLILN